MKIDTTQIPDFDTLPTEAKNAILAMEFADAPDMSQYVAKSIFDKKASEAADLSKRLKSYMTEDEAAKAQAAEYTANLEARVKELEHKETVSAYVNSYLAMGYDDKLAKSTAEALAKGDMETVFKNQKTHNEAREKALKAELLKQTPNPPSGNPDNGKTKEEFGKMSLAEKQQLFKENPEAYSSFYNK